RYHGLLTYDAIREEDQSVAGSAGGYVAYVGDAGEFAFVDEFGNAAGQVVRVGHIRQFGNDQGGAVLDFFDIDDGAHGDRATAGAVGLFDAGVAQDGGPGGEVWAFNAFQQGFEEFFAAGFGVVQVPLHTFGDFAQVMRWDLGGHAHGNPGGPVD